jgi:Tn3 transposase DDE domain
VLTSSVITWTTEYYQLAVWQRRIRGRDVPDEILAHISPAHSENVNFFRVIIVDVVAELAKLDPAGWRPAAAPRRTGSEPAAVTGVERPLLMDLSHQRYGAREGTVTASPEATAP